ncbi:hypothetical protein TGAM01_v202523 [Trichoderma gamsii]|uniref:Uncharacterized protein n=1 Tax=Trichoderma gamsii TaxID=398673 RepID=A0A2P4ZWL9_9HYPO|nr:hypothetical protein TGAM01_v202523 [Trichoderma gamsii]PON28676.1 hypothetical protein TGAM01_v202523 [Trichoderma gamsii]
MLLAVGCWPPSPVQQPLPARHGTSASDIDCSHSLIRAGANASWPRGHIRRDTSNHRSATDFLALPQAKQRQGTELSQSTCYLSSPGPCASMCCGLSCCSPPIAGLGSPPMPEAVLDILVHNLRQPTLTSAALALHGGLDVDVVMPSRPHLMVEPSWLGPIHGDSLSPVHIPRLPRAGRSILAAVNIDSLH